MKMGAGMIWFSSSLRSSRRRSLSTREANEARTALGRRKRCLKLKPMLTMLTVLPECLRRLGPTSRLSGGRLTFQGKHRPDTRNDNDTPQGSDDDDGDKDNNNKSGARSQRSVR